ncbi:MAG: hypothetical protein MI922_23370 [Bacteroidales bacterium]|nr:hypothetical protein [Bacteroidales bacterium]
MILINSRYHLTIVKRALSFILLFFISSTYGQYTEDTRISFGARIKHPITIHIKKDQNQIVFYAKNQSYFTYDISIKFKEVINLNSNIILPTYTVGHGETRLITFTIHDTKQPHHYDYLLKYHIRPSKIRDDSFKYLHPIGENKKCNTEMILPGTNVNKRYLLQKGDTVFAMRKGLIVANTNKLGKEERIFLKNSFEIQQSDGTVLVFKNVYSNDIILKKAGNMVYPGQPLFVINSKTRTLNVNVFNINEDEIIKTIPINFNCCDKTAQDKFETEYPEELIILEMKLPEKQRYANNELY